MYEITSFRAKLLIASIMISVWNLSDALRSTHTHTHTHTRARARARSEREREREREKEREKSLKTEKDC